MDSVVCKILAAHQESSKKMRFLRRLTRGSKAESNKDAPSSEQRNLALREYARENADLISHWELSITLSLSTPLEWLLRHNETASEPSDVPAHIGIWLPKLEGKLDLLMRDSSQWSPIGPVPKDGGELLPFLIRYREIVEADEPRTLILKKLQRLELDNPEISVSLGGDLGKRFIVFELISLPGCGRRSAERLLEAGYLSKQDVAKASIEELTKIEGIGKATARKLTGM